MKRSPVASSSLAPSPRIASVISSPSKRVSGRASAVGWNWQNSRSARSAPAAAPKTGPAPIAPRGLVVRRHSAAAPPVASTVAREPSAPTSVIDPVAALAVGPERRRRGPLADLDPLVGGDHRGQLRGDLAAGLAAAGVDDPPRRVAALEAQRQPPFLVEVEDDAARQQVADRGGRLLDQHLDRGGAAEPAAGGERVLGVALRRVARLERRGEPALRPEAGALRERRARDHADPAAQLGGAQCGPQSGGAAADDDDVVLRDGGYLSPLSRRTASIFSRSQAAAPSRARALSAATACSAASARRSAAAIRSSAVSACSSISPSRSSAAAIACSLAERSLLSSSSWRSSSSLRTRSDSVRQRSRSASSAWISASARCSAAAAASAAAARVRSASPIRAPTSRCRCCARMLVAHPYVRSALKAPI